VAHESCGKGCFVDNTDEVVWCLSVNVATPHDLSKY